MKKPPSTAVQSERRRKSGAVERTNTAPTPRASEDGTSAGVVEPLGEATNGKTITQGEVLVSPATAASLSLDESSGEVEQFATVRTSGDNDDTINGQSCFTPRQALDVRTRGDVVDSDVGAVEGAISIVLTKVIDKIVEHEQVSCSVAANIDREEEITVVNVVLEQEEVADVLILHNPLDVVNGDNSADSFGISEYAEVEHQDDKVLPGNYDNPVVAHVEDVGLPSHELHVAVEHSEEVFEEAHTEEPLHLEEVYPAENDCTEDGHETADTTQDSGAIVYESAIDGTLTDVDFTQDALDSDNAETNEAPSEPRAETPIEGDTIFETNEAIVPTDEHLQLSPVEGEESGAIDDGVVYNEEVDRDSPGEALPGLSYEQLDPPKGEQITPAGDVNEQVVGKEEAEESRLANDSEEIAPGLETYVAEIHPDHEHIDENYASAELTITGTEAQQEGFESVHQDEVGHDTSGFVDEAEQADHTDELQNHEGDEVQYTSEQELQQDWTYNEQTEPSVVENAGDFAGYYYQEAYVPSHEELTNYADKTETSVYYNDPADDGSALLTDTSLADAPISDEGPVGVDPSAQEPATIE